MALSREPLAKALGIKGNKKPLVFDCTFGTGKDSFLMLHFGAKVVGFERHPEVIKAINDALIRSTVLKEENLPFEFVPKDIMDADLSKFPEVDTLYYDPMYGEKNEKALPRKEMQAFREIVGPDTDSQSFLDWTDSVSYKRLVVKRPLKSPAIRDNPDIEFKGKSTRYDVYLKLTP